MLHPHIIQFKEVFLTQKYLAIAMEYADGGDMFQHVKNHGGLPEFEVSSANIFACCLRFINLGHTSNDKLSGILRDGQWISCIGAKSTFEATDH